MKTRTPLDTYDIMPDEMRAYLRHNGWHFNKKMLEFACHTMKKNGERIKPWTKEEVKDMLTKASISIDTEQDYDFVFVANMAKADFYQSSLKDESSVAQFVKDYVEDTDQADGFILNRFYADCVRNGRRIPWEELV